MVYKYFPDTNILVSGIIWGGNEARIIELAKRGVIILVVSKYVLDELSHTLKKLGLNKDEVDKNVEFIKSIASDIVDANKNEVSVCMNDVRFP